MFSNEIECKVLKEILSSSLRAGIGHLRCDCLLGFGQVPCFQLAHL